MALDRHTHYSFTPSNATDFDQLKLYVENQLRKLSDSLTLTQDHTQLKVYYKKPDVFIEDELFIFPSESDNWSWGDPLAPNTLASGFVYLYYGGNFIQISSL
jgi:hypothetical protein